MTDSLMEQFFAVHHQLVEAADPEVAEGMARFGINPEKTLGVQVYKLRELAKEAGHDHELAARLWESGIHEARILASIADEPAKVTVEQMERWAMEFDSWDVCDGCCSNLFEKTPYALDMAVEWSGREEEFVKRAGYVLMARLAVGKKKATEEQLESFLPHIIRGANDERNMVKKAVNWALRQIGKHDLRLNGLAIQTGEKIAEMDLKSARWIASDALKELRSDAVQERLMKKSG